MVFNPSPRRAPRKTAGTLFVVVPLGLAWRGLTEHFLLLILFRTRNRCKISVSPDTSTCVFANQTALHCDTPS